MWEYMKFWAAPYVAGLLFWLVIFALFIVGVTFLYLRKRWKYRKGGAQFKKFQATMESYLRSSAGVWTRRDVARKLMNSYRMDEYEYRYEKACIEAAYDAAAKKLNYADADFIDKLSYNQRLVFQVIVNAANSINTGDKFICIRAGQRFGKTVIVNKAVENLQARRKVVFVASTLDRARLSCTLYNYEDFYFASAKSFSELVTDKNTLVIVDEALWIPNMDEILKHFRDMGSVVVAVSAIGPEEYPADARLLKFATWDNGITLVEDLKHSFKQDFHAAARDYGLEDSRDSAKAKEVKAWRWS